MVTQAEIIKWFCMGFGFGEIEHAYVISAYAHVPVEEVFDKRLSGLGWGQIKQDYGLLSFSKKGPGGKDSANNSHGKNNKPGKKP